MNIWKTLNALQALGTLLTVVGELSKRIGEALLGPNLGPERDLPASIDKEELQDSLAHGAEDEKPEPASFSDEA